MSLDFYGRSPQISDSSWVFLKNLFRIFEYILLGMHVQAHMSWPLGANSLFHSFVRKTWDCEQIAELKIPNVYILDESLAWLEYFNRRGCLLNLQNTTPYSLRWMILLWGHTLHPTLWSAPQRGTLASQKEGFVLAVNPNTCEDVLNPLLVVITSNLLSNFQL